MVLRKCMVYYVVLVTIGGCGGTFVASGQTSLMIPLLLIIILFYPIPHYTYLSVHTDACLPGLVFFGWSGRKLDGGS